MVIRARNALAWGIRGHNWSQNDVTKSQACLYQSAICMTAHVHVQLYLLRCREGVTQYITGTEPIASGESANDIGIGHLTSSASRYAKHAD